MNRRAFFIGSAALIAAPSIVRASTLMPSSVVGIAHLQGSPVPAYGRSILDQTLADLLELNWAIARAMLYHPTNLRFARRL